MRGLIGQNRLRRFRLFEPIFSYNFALGLEFGLNMFQFRKFQVQLMLDNKGATSYFQAGTTYQKVLGAIVQHTDAQYSIMIAAGLDDHTASP